MAGLNPRHLPEHIPTGRAFDARSGIEIQVALLDEDPAGPAQVAALAELARRATARDAALPAAARPEPIGALPAHVGLSAVLQRCRWAAGLRPAGGPAVPAAGRRRRRGRRPPIALVGVGGDRLDPAAGRPDQVRSGIPGRRPTAVGAEQRSGRDGPHAGPARVRGRGRHRPPVPRPGRACKASRPAWPAWPPSSTAGPSAPVTSTPCSPPSPDRSVVVVVDDAELLNDSPIGETLAGFRPHRPGPGQRPDHRRNHRRPRRIPRFHPRGPQIAGRAPAVPERTRRRRPARRPTAPDRHFRRPARAGVSSSQEWEMQIVQVPFDDTRPTPPLLIERGPPSTTLRPAPAGGAISRSWRPNADLTGGRYGWCNLCHPRATATDRRTTDLRCGRGRVHPLRPGRLRVTPAGRLGRPGPAAVRGLWLEWQNSARGLHEALTGIATLTQQAGTRYESNEQGIAATFRV